MRLVGIALCMTVNVVYPTCVMKNLKNSFRILSVRFILVKGEGKIRFARIGGASLPQSVRIMFFIIQNIKRHYYCVQREPTKKSAGTYVKRVLIRKPFGVLFR